MNIRVTMDGIIFETQKQGGISRMYQEILPRLCGADPSSRISLFTKRALAQPVPAGSCIDYFQIHSPERFLRPTRLFGRTYPLVRAVCAHPYLMRRRTSVWHSTYYTMPLSWDGPIVTTVHDLIHERFPNLFSSASDEALRARKRKSINSSSVIIAVSESTKEDLTGYYGVSPERVKVIHLAAGSTFQQQLNDEVAIRERPYLLYVGNRGHYKNASLLLEAYARWHGNSDVDLLMVGPPPTSKEVTLVNDLSVAGRVGFISDAGDRTLATMYLQAIALVYPSLYEGFGIPLVEAMSSGCPIIASRIPSSVEVAGDAAIYFDPDNGETLLQALDEVMDTAARQALAQRGRLRGESFSWEKAARELALAYRLAQN